MFIKSFKFKIYSRVLVTFLMVFILFTWLNLRFVSKTLTGEAKEKYHNLLKSKVEEINSYFAEKRKIVWTLKENPVLKSWLPVVGRDMDLENDQTYHEIVNYFAKMVKDDSDLKSGFFASEHSQYYYDFSGHLFADDYFLDNRPWYQNVKKIRY